VAPVPDEWKNEHNEGELYAACMYNLGNWWEVFDDPVLSYLEEYAIESNNNLWAALEKIVQARAVALENKSYLYPQVNFAPSMTRYGMLFLNPLSQSIGSGQSGAATAAGSASSGAGAPAAATTPAAPNISSLLGSIPSIFRVKESQYELPFNMSYELDIWSKLQSAYDASYYQYEATIDDYINVYMTMTADVATNYFILRNLDAQQDILERTIGSRQKGYDINLTRYNAGIIADLDVANAEVELARAQADNIDIRRQRLLQENIIATLIGTPASEFSLERNPLAEGPPAIPTILPSELLRRRPDIAAAERQLAASYANIEVAYAAFFPSVNLNAALGLESPFAHLLFDWKARLWQVGVSAMQSVFDGGYRSANLEYMRSAFRQAYANYEESVLQGFKDVEDALVTIKEKGAQYNALTRAVKAAGTTLNLSQERYDHGLINYLNVVDAERTLLEVEQTHIQSLGDQYTGTINLIRAMGGCWN